MSTISFIDPGIFPELPVHRFSSSNYVRLVDEGVLTSKDKVELVHGIIVDKNETAFVPHQFTAEQYMGMVELGVIQPSDRVELINGVILEMSPAGSCHNQFLGQMNRLLAPLLDRMEVWIQGTMSLGERDIVDPDIMLLPRRPGGYKHRLPEANDVLLLVEASDTSLRWDERVKLPLYAKAGISEYWIADLDRELITVYRKPRVDKYDSVEPRQGDDLISPLAAPELAFAVRQAFE